MTNGGGPEGDGADPSRRPANLDERLERLEHELDARAPRAGTPAPSPASSSAMGMALRISTEFVAGVAVGAGLGWLFDYFLGTSPWGLIVFLFLGFAAGMLNVMRSTGLIRRPSPNRGDGSH